ncbi:hypothetical protein Y888_06500 [Mixta calida B021323]|nr:hypothetical protein Y888_06500 [Mixta calida B021323]
MVIISCVYIFNDITALKPILLGRKKTIINIFFYQPAVVYPMAGLFFRYIVMAWIKQQAIST